MEAVDLPSFFLCQAPCLPPSGVAGLVLLESSPKLSLQLRLEKLAPAVVLWIGDSFPRGSLKCLVSAVETGTEFFESFAFFMWLTLRDLAMCLTSPFRYGGSYGGGGSRGYGGGGGGGGRGRGGQPGSTLRKPRWDLSRLPRFEKDFYREHPDVANRTQVNYHGTCHMTFGPV